MRKTKMKNKLLRAVCAAAFLLTCMLWITSCSHTVSQAESANTASSDAYAMHDFDFADVKAIQIRSGITGNTILLTKQSDMEAIINAVTPLSGRDPISSRGYYGWSYDFMFFETSSPNDKDTPILSFALCDFGNSTAYLTYGVYEEVNGHSYSAMYTVDPSTVDAVADVCTNYLQ